MKKAILASIALTLASLCNAAGPAGEIISMSCSKAVASVFQYVETEGLEIDLNQTDAVVVCVGPANGEILIRIQTPGTPASERKHTFRVDSESFVVTDYAYSR